jgi:hypothetical protein
LSSAPQSDSRREIDEAVLAWMREWSAQVASESSLGSTTKDPDEDETRFDELARRIFAFQYRHCETYARFCDLKGVSPESVDSWRDIPAVPTGAFKEAALRCFPEAKTQKIFRTSGTSGMRRGELYLDTLAVYEASLLPTLQRYLLVESRRETKRWNLQILAPDVDEAADSSLSHMFSHLLETVGNAESAFHIRGGQLQHDALLAALERATANREAVVLCGTAFAFVHLLDALDERDGATAGLPLPPDSRIMETGGFKGRAREVPRDDLHRDLSSRFGIPESSIVNQYGMTELGSQFYDSVLADPDGPRRKLGPPWARVRVVDPEDGRELPAGEPGLLVVSDLANTGSIAAIQTADLGRRVDATSRSRADHGDGFEVLGREPDAEARGCSIGADALLGDAP